MDNLKKQRPKSLNLENKTLEETPTIPEKDVSNGDDVADATVESIEYDYMKYPNQKKKSLEKRLKPQKNVSFKMMVELVTYTDNWKMKMIESRLRTEEEQLKNSLKRRNF
ncbi:uncharacterized protein Dana_GF13585 [Drosophila ananassae]|uniref:Uncharacterized protein n=1 Tax=Drosophila ananassae TaxID=7217 RepID=B3MF81_DROAN|nr:uncharacterized protein LOC6496424 [Drosophila ananassae]EDV37709.1 uncharacterized protein Dana_GF13585 [Drosophila ananassae]